MRKRILLLLTVFILTGAYAQMTPDDKLKFQQAQDAYDNGNYFGAAQLAYNTGKKWTAPVLYLYIKSVHKSYLQAGSANVGYDKTYDNFTLFNSYCEQFFKTVDKNTYPQDKYADVVKAQEYFLQMQKNYLYQKDRTPQKAVAFLNECLRKFEKVAVLREKRYYGETELVSENRPVFQLDSPYLKLVHYGHDKRYYGKGKKAYTTNVTYYRVVLIDFSRATNFSNNSNGLLAGQIAYENGVKLMQHELLKSDFTRIDNYDNASKAPDDNIARNEAQQRKINSDTTGFPPQLKTGGWAKSIAGIDVLNFFNTTSQEFIDGKYQSRIIEAFQYLVSYYPKVKTTTPDDKTNGF